MKVGKLRVLKNNALGAAILGALLVFVMVFLRISCWDVTRFALRIPRYVKVSGPVNIGGRSRPEFSPDGKVLAYIWSDAEHKYPAQLAPRPLTLTERIEIRARRLDSGAQELRVPLDSVDLRPEGVSYFDLDAGIRVSPDSRHVIGYCARRFILVDLADGTSRTIEYRGEFIRSLAWLGSGEITFSTTEGATVTFWRYGIDSPPSERIKVYTEACKNEAPLFMGLPPDLRGDRWSPKGTFVAFWSFAKDPAEGEYALLDLRTGTLHTFPFSPPYYQCWKPDESGLLLASLAGLQGGLSRVLLVEPDTANVTNLTNDFKRAFGNELNITIVSSLWTADGQYVVLYRTMGSPPATPQPFRGYVVQPHPFRVILEKDRILQRSPLPGWTLLQGQDNFTWIDLAGEKTLPIEGWVNDWIWSADGKLAAKISQGQVEVFSPTLPPNED